MKKVLALICGILFLFCAKLEDKAWNNPIDKQGENYHPPKFEKESDTVTISINDYISTMEPGNDDNGSVVKYLWALDGENYNDETDTNVIKTTFSTIGNYIVKVKAVDNDGVKSEKAKIIVVKVKKFEPQITPVKDIFVAIDSTVKIHVKAEDSHGEIEKYLWDKDGDDKWDDTTDSDTPEYEFSNSSGGPITVIWGALDDDGFISTDEFLIIFNRPPTSVSMIDPSDGDTATYIEFDKVNMKGSVDLHFKGIDPDSSVDVLTYTLYLGEDMASMDNVYSGTNTSYRAEYLDTSETYFWQLRVHDLFGDSAVNDGKFYTPSVDLVPPVITLIGDNPLMLSLAVHFKDPGATAIDNVDGDVSDKIVVSGDSVNTKEAGTYEVVYTVEDVMENDTSVTREVIVEEYILLEDFETGPSYQSAFGELFGTGSTDSVGYWRAWTDGISTFWDPDPDSSDSAFEYIVMPDIGFDGSAGFHAMPRVWDPNLDETTWGAGFYLKKSDTHYDISDMDSITFYAKVGGAGEIVNARFDVVYPGIDWGYAGVGIELAESWQKYVIKPEDFAGVPDSPGKDHDWDDAKDEVKMFRFVNHSEVLGDVDLYLDDIRIYGSFSGSDLIKDP